jgi:hypothetical protein
MTLAKFKTLLTQIQDEIPTFDSGHLKSATLYGITPFKTNNKKNGFLLVIPLPTFGTDMSFILVY